MSGGPRVHVGCVHVGAPILLCRVFIPVACGTCACLVPPAPLRHVVSVDDEYHVAIITPVIHYCMGGVAANERSEVSERMGGTSVSGHHCVHPASPPLALPSNPFVVFFFCSSHFVAAGSRPRITSQVLSDRGIIRGLYVAGEAMGGVHGSNRLGGSSLLDCVVFGRIAGREATK